ncbi:MAG: ribosomal-protein-alanine N-acetyltransferase [Flavobacteriales bacterium]|jgi:RimJ/RimL family protein N-acetyltransferase
MQIILETERLYLREFLSEDALHFHQLNSDPEVLKYTGDPPFASLEEAQSFIANYTAYSQYGIGRYAIIRKSDEAFLGWCGFKYHPEERIVDLGYRLHRLYWRQGYATESAQAALTFAFENRKYLNVVAHAHVENKGSDKVLANCNFTKLREITYDGQPTFLYQKQNPFYDLRIITAEETWPVRHPVLRKGRPLEDVYMEADEKENTFHIGIFFKETIVGVASFMEDTHPDFEGTQSRLRGMAVLPEFRKRGLAAAMLIRAEKLLRERNRSILWFNARLAALNFYKEMGYKTVGTEFDIPLVGPHYVMKKKL